MTKLKQTVCVSCYHLLILIPIVLEAQKKKEQKAATDERARACKENQAKNQAKATERDRRQNQENIGKLLSSLTLPLLMYIGITSSS